MEITDLPLECQLLIMEKLTRWDVTALRSIHQVCKQWHDLAISSRVICKDLRLRPGLYDARVPLDDLVRWSRKRAGLVNTILLNTFPEKDPSHPAIHYIGGSWRGKVEAVLQVMTDENDMRLAEEKLLQILRYAAPNVTTLWVEDWAHQYGYKASVASLLGPAMPLFRNLRHLRAEWAGDGLDRRHLNCLQDVPLLECLTVTYWGNVDLGPHFPEGLGKLRFLRSLTLTVTPRAALGQTSLCSLPGTLSQLSALTHLSLGRYFDDVETHALLHCTSLRRVHLIENLTKDLTSADWVRYLPTSLVSLTVSGNEAIRSGIDCAPQRRVRPLRTVPCVLGLTQLINLSFQFLKGFRLSEWNDVSCLTGLSRLCNLEMSFCSMRKVPNAVVGLSSLRRLCLGGNKLVALPVGRYLQGLEELVLVDNRFTSVPMEALAAATALTCVTMGGNPLAWSAAEAEFVKRIKEFIRSHQHRGFVPRWY